jgi:hypothetical protein
VAGEGRGGVTYGEAMLLLASVRGAIATGRSISAGLVLWAAISWSAVGLAYAQEIEAAPAPSANLNCVFSPQTRLAGGRRVQMQGPHVTLEVWTEGEKWRLLAVDKDTGHSCTLDWGNASDLWIPVIEMGGPT